MGNGYKGCEIPKDLYYDLEYHVWAKIDKDTVIVGATDPAQAYAGEIIYIKIKDKGTKIDRGGILATVESAKYMGPMRSPVSGVIIEVNQEVASNPTLINQDAYENWVVKLKAENLDKELQLLTPGNEAAEKYRSIIDEWGIECREE